MSQEKSISEEVKIAIINYLSRNWEDCDSTMLNSWLEEDSENSRLFGQLVDLWEADQILRGEQSFDPSKAWTRLESKMNIKPSIVVRLGGINQLARYAAIFILALVLGGIGSYLIQGHFESNLLSKNTVEYTAPYGSKTNLKLLDGSHVWLNAGTTLKYNQGFGTTNRDIQLVGEAYFEVAKSKKLPFIVNAKEISVTAVGTKFNVKAYPEEKMVETILLEGSVKLENEQKSVLLHPNQKAIIDSKQDGIVVSNVKNLYEVSWRTDNWIIKNTNLGSLAKLLERRYNIEITFDVDSIKNYEFAGIIKDETIEQVLTAITYVAPLKYKIVNKNVTISIDKDKLNKYDKILR